MPLAISRANGCTYCVAAHSAVADRARVPTAVTDAFRAGDPLPDPRLDALATFTTTMVDKRGLPSRADLETFLAAGFEERDTLQVVLAIAVKTLSNYSFEQLPDLCRGEPDRRARWGWRIGDLALDGAPCPLRLGCAAGVGRGAREWVICSPSMTSSLAVLGSPEQRQNR